MDVELEALRARVRELESKLAEKAAAREAAPISASPLWVSSLTSEELARYGRQMLVPGFGAATQTSLRSLRVLIVGAGGLGCPAALYLAGAGVGTIAIIDDDVVETSNLHRQIGHCDAFLGQPKAASLCAALRRINPAVTAIAHVARLGPRNSADLVRAADIVLDCSDNPATRYLVNDACVLAGRPLVSGAALGTNGQLSVHAPGAGPCYRCVNPVPPAREAVGSCADHGVLGPVTGVIGALQAMEVLKIVSARASVHPSPIEPLTGRMLVWDSADARMRNVALRPRSPECSVCGTEPRIRSTEDSWAWSLDMGLAAREGEHAGGAACERGLCHAAGSDIGGAIPTISALDLLKRMEVAGASGNRSMHRAYILVDVRPLSHFDLYSLAGSLSLPLSVIERDPTVAIRTITTAAAMSVGGGDATSSGAASGVDFALTPPERDALKSRDSSESEHSVGDAAPIFPSSVDVFMICRRGVDSALATRILLGHRHGDSDSPDASGTPVLAPYNVSGGLEHVSEALALQHW